MGGHRPRGPNLALSAGKSSPFPDRPGRRRQDAPCEKGAGPWGAAPLPVGEEACGQAMPPIRSYLIGLPTGSQTSLPSIVPAMYLP